MNEQELNKKLAEWAGLKHDEDGSCCPIDGDYFRFTDSLDACFKWLIPKPPSYNPDVRLIQSVTFDYGMCRILDIMGDEYEGEGQTPALALCLAIEKLIDGEK